MLRLILFLAVTVLPVLAADTALQNSFRDTFDEAGPGAMADVWEVSGGTWRVAAGALVGTSATRRGFAYVPDVPEAEWVQVRVPLRIAKRDNGQGWCTAGVVVMLGPTDFWQLAMVEGPDHKRYAELVEMFAGTWQAQRTGASSLKQVENEGQWAGWEYNHDYVLTLTLSPETVEGTIADAETGKTVTRIAYEWGDAPGMKSGRPGLMANGLTLEAQEVASRWRGSASGVQGLAVETGRLGTVALLASSANAGKDIAEALRAAGYGVTVLGNQDVTTEGVLDPRRFDVLALPDSPHFPLAAMEPLQRFLRGGGDLVLMGGLPFSTLLLHMGDEWLTQAQVDERLRQTPVRQLLFDFESGDTSAWSRASNHLEMPSRAVLVAGPTGKALELDIRGLDGWDTFAVDLPDGLPVSDNVLLFSAAASPGTSAMVVELREGDGSRWIATVELGEEWTAHVLPATRFEFWGDASPTGRGNTGDVVHFGQVRSLSFGLAGSHTPGLRGDHTIRVDQIGTGHAVFPEPAPEGGVSLNAFSDYEVYRMADVRSIAPAPGEDGASGLAMEMACQGWSAVGFAFPNESVFVPLAVARDASGRSQGWAAGALLNYRGMYRNSAWLLFGVETPAFYGSPVFLQQLPGLLAGARTAERFQALRRAEREGRQAGYALETPPPHAGFIRRSADGRHLVYPDGRRFFMMGCNYVGGFARCGGRMWNDDFFDAREVESDFRKASEAGLNVMRYWLQGSLDEDLRAGRVEKVQTIRECARRYGVYLLLDLPGTGYSTEEAMLASHRRIAEAFRDEPMVLGYDLRNEPYVTTLGGIRYTGEPAAVQTVDLAAQYPGRVDLAKVDGWLKERPWWLHLPSWIQGEEARKVAAANVLWSQYTSEFGLRSSTLTGLAGSVPEGAWKPLVEVVNRSLDRWLSVQVKAIRDVDPNHLITVGHNTALTILPANAQLDFVSEHIYARPLSHDLVKENFTTLDRLRTLWPDRPITLGEFGYSNGIPVKGGYLDPHTSSVGEMIHYLYAFANDYDGCKKWMLVDWPLAVMRHYGDWNRGLVTRTYEERFGLFSYDGTSMGRAKPIVPALRFFRDLVDRMPPGGTLEVTHDDNPIDTGYVYRADQALFVGGRRADLPGLRYQSGETANVMLMWTAEGMRLMSTADATVEINPRVLAPGLAGGVRVADGALAAELPTDGWWKLSLAAGRPVAIR
jgi:hypothetical protein